MVKKAIKIIIYLTIISENIHRIKKKHSVFAIEKRFALTIVITEAVHFFFEERSSNCTLSRYYR